MKWSRKETTRPGDGGSVAVHREFDERSQTGFRIISMSGKGFRDGLGVAGGANEANRRARNHEIHERRRKGDGDKLVRGGGWPASRKSVQVTTALEAEWP